MTYKDLELINNAIRNVGGAVHRRQQDEQTNLIMQQLYPERYSGGYTGGVQGALLENKLRDEQIKRALVEAQTGYYGRMHTGGGGGGGAGYVGEDVEVPPGFVRTPDGHIRRDPMVAAARGGGGGSKVPPKLADWNATVAADEAAKNAAYNVDPQAWKDNYNTPTTGGAELDKQLMLHRAARDAIAATYGQPAPSATPSATPGKTLDKETAKFLLEAAGGDRQKAEALARERGYTF